MTETARLEARVSLDAVLVSRPSVGDLFQRFQRSGHFERQLQSLAERDINEYDDDLFRFPPAPAGEQLVATVAVAAKWEPEYPHAYSFIVSEFNGHEQSTGRALNQLYPCFPVLISFVHIRYGLDGRGYRLILTHVGKYHPSIVWSVPNQGTGVNGVKKSLLSIRPADHLRENTAAAGLFRVVTQDEVPPLCVSGEEKDNARRRRAGRGR